MTARKKQFLIAFAVSTAIAKVGSSQVVTSTNVGPSFVVPDTIPGNPQYNYQPDGRIAYLPDPENPGEFEMYWAGGNYVSEGTSITSQSGPLNSTDLLPGTPAPSYDQHNWLMSVYPESVSVPGAPAGDLIGFFHAEDYNFNGITGGTWKSQGVAYSTNDGLSWTIGGQILSVPKPSVVSQGGFGDMSVVWNPANSTWYSFTGEGPYGAESTSPTGAPGTWSMYSNGGFNSPGLNGTPTALPGLQNYSGGSPDYVYSTYLGEWCRVWVDAFSGGRNVLLSTTSDLVHYDPVVTLLTNPSSVNNITYPTVIGTSDISMGQNAWLYSGVFLPSGSRQFTAEAIHLSKVTAVPTTFTGSGGDGNWATAANWGGTAISDEGQSLIYSSATGTSQTNNLAAGTRVQGITFNAGAGANTITPSTGNTLELEGDFTNNSTATQTYNGNIDQQTAQINFNAAGGNIVIGGTVNVTNSGGLVISGSNNVSLGGVIQTGLLFGNGGSFADTQIIKSGSGTLILTGPGTFAGQTFVNSGVVQLNNALAVQNSTVTLALSNSLNLNGLNATIGSLAGGGNLSLGTSTSLTLGNNNSSTNYATANYFGTLSGSGSLVKSGNSTQILSGNNTFTGSVSVSAGTLTLEGSNSYSGGTNLNGGILATPLDASLGTLGLTFNGGTLQALASFSSSRTMLLNGAGTIDTDGQTLTLNGNITGSGLLTKIGAGILVLRGSDQSTGGILVNGGEVNASSAANLGSAGLNLSGGALQLGASFDPSVVGITTGSGGGTIDTNGFNTAFSTPISGSGSLTKIGAGTLSFASAPIYTGATTINGGTLQSTGTSGAVFGTGGVTINNGLISFLPNFVSSASNTSVTFGSAASQAINTSGNAGIVLGKNGNNSLSVMLGESGGTGIASTGNGTITLANASGIANLGSTAGEQLLVAGTAPAVTNGIVAPWMIGQASTSSATADFLTYNSTAGFIKTANYTTRTGTFTPVANEISNITATATANTGNPYAVRLGAFTLTLAGGATVTVGNGTYGGVILNGGTITGGTLAFNAAESIVYTSTTSAINSPITGTGGLTVFGPGTLILGSSSNTLAGNIVVNGTTLNTPANAAFGAATNVITLNAGTLTPTTSYTQTHSVTVGTAGGTFNTGSNQLTFTGALTGAGTIVKTGTGALIVSGGSADTLTGNISVNAGILQTASGASLASTTGTITVASGASFDAFGNYDGAIISNPIWLSGTGAGGYGALNGGGNVTLQGAVTLLADSTISHDYNYFTLNSSITAANHNLTLASTQLGQPYMAVNDPVTLGTGAITITGPNGVSLNGVDSYSGGTNVNSGTLQLGNTGALGSGLLAVNGGTVDLNGLSVTVNGLGGTASGLIGSSSTISNSSLTVNQNGSSTFAGTLADTVAAGTTQLSLNVGGSGSLTLSGTNTFSGTTRINSGSLILGSSLALQNSTLDLDPADTGTISFGSLTAASLGGLEGARNLSNALMLTIGGNAQTTLYSGNLSGSGSLIKIGNGLLEFSGTNSYTGGTIINGGALQFDSSGALPTSPALLMLNAGGAVAATGAYNGVTAWLNSGKISSSTAGALALTANSSEAINLTTAGGGAFSNITLGAVGNVTYTGIYTPLGNTYRFGGGGGTLDYSPAINGSKSVAVANPGVVVLTGSNNYSGGTTITAGTLQIGSTSAMGTGSVTVSSGGTLDLNGYNIGSKAVSLGGAGVNGLGALQNSSATANATSSGIITLTANATIGVDSSAYAGRMDIGGGTTCINGSTYTLTKAGPGTLRIDGGAFTVGALNISAGALDVLGNNNVLIAGRPVSVSSGATLFLYNDNDAANTTLLAGGTLEDNAGNNAVSGTTTLSGSGNANFTIDSPITLTVSGQITGTGGLNIVGNSGLAVVLTNSSNNWSGGTTLNTGTLQVGSGGTSGVLPGSISNNTALVFDRTDSVTYSGVISGTGSVSQIGSGLLILTATNSYTGNTNISNGVLRANDGVGLPAASALILAGGILETGTNFVRSLGTTSGTVALSAGADGFSAYGGPVTVSLGGLSTPTTLVWGSTANFSPTSLILNANSASSTLTLQNPIDFNGANQTIGVGAAAAIAGGVLSSTGTGGLIKTGAGTLILTAPNTYNGNTNISAGTLQMGNGGTTGVIVGNIIDNASLNFNRSDASLTFANNISGSGTIAQSGAGILILSGTNSYSGQTGVNSGEVQLASSTALGNSTAGVVVANGATLDENGFPQGSEPVTITGSGLTGLGALINSNTSSNASVGPVTLTGNAIIGVEGSAYAGRMDIGGGTTCVNGSTYTLTKAGPGILRINGGTFSVGAINVSAGLFDVLGNNNVLSTGLPVSVSSGAILFLYNSNDAANTMFASNSILENNSGANGLSGTTTLNGPGKANFNFDNNSGLTLTVSGPITGTGGMSMTVSASGGKLLLTSGSNNYSGGTLINSGILMAGAVNSLSPNSAFNVAGGTLDASEFNNSIASINVSSTGTLNLGIGNLLTVTGAASFGGTLNLSTGTVSSLPENLMTFSSHSGTFSTSIGIPNGDKLLYTTNALELVGSGATNLTWNNAGGSGDGITWNTSQLNWSNGTGAVAYSDTSNSTTGDNVSFTDANNGNYNVTIASTVHPTSVVVNSSGAYIFNGSGGIAGTTTLTKLGTGSLTLNTADSYTGVTNVNVGTLILAAPNAFPTSGALIISSGAQVSIAGHGIGMPLIPVLSSLSNTGTIDLTNNAMIVHNGSMGTIAAQIALAYNNGLWNGTGSGVITSSTAATNTTHLTALGIATGLTSFEGQSILAADVLVKYTYYGDADLSGITDGSDYSRIDNGYLTDATGWYNGDFNYDGVVNGSDYTLIDNAFNSQGVQITNEIALPTDQVAQVTGTAAVPEPATLSLLAISVTALLGRRSRMRKM